MKSDTLLVVAFFCLIVSNCAGHYVDFREFMAGRHCDEKCIPAAGALLDGRCACAGGNGWWQVQP